MHTRTGKTILALLAGFSLLFLMAGCETMRPEPGGAGTTPTAPGTGGGAQQPSAPSGGGTY